MLLYRSEGESSDEEDDGQKIPAWAQDANLRREIAGQQKLDPDELFQQNEKTCPLEEVFASLRDGMLLHHTMKHGVHIGCNVMSKWCMVNRSINV